MQQQQQQQQQRQQQRRQRQQQRRHNGGGRHSGGEQHDSLLGSASKAPRHRSRRGSFGDGCRSGSGVNIGSASGTRGPHESLMHYCGRRLRYAISSSFCQFGIFMLGYTVVLLFVLDQFYFRPMMVAQKVAAAATATAATATAAAVAHDVRPATAAITVESAP